MKQLYSIETKSENETMLVAEKIANTVGKGVIILLKGDLGAGKTHFVKGFAKGIGYQGTVTSPTFTLLNIYNGGKFPVYHFDMYRLSSSEEANELGFEEYFDLKTLDGITIVEWPENVQGLITCPRIVIEIQKLSENNRKIIVGSEL